MKLRKIASIVALAAIAIVGGAQSAAAYGDLPPVGTVSGTEHHNNVLFALSHRESHPHLIPAATAGAAAVTSLSVNHPARATRVSNLITHHGVQVHHIDADLDAFHSVSALINGVWTPLSGPGTTPNAHGGFGDENTFDFHTMEGSTVIVLNRSFLQRVGAGNSVQLVAMFTGDIAPHVFTATGIAGAPAGDAADSVTIAQHPATGPATLLYAVGALLLAGGGTAIAASAKRRKVENV